MTIAGWIFMIASVGTVTLFTGYCVTRVLSAANDD